MRRYEISPQLDTLDHPPAAILINTAIVASFRLSAPPAALYPQGRGLPEWASGFLDSTTAVLAIELLIVFISDGFIFAERYALAPHKALLNSADLAILLLAISDRAAGGGLTACASPG